MTEVAVIAVVVAPVVVVAAAVIVVASSSSSSSSSLSSPQGDGDLLRNSGTNMERQPAEAGEEPDGLVDESLSQMSLKCRTKVDDGAFGGGGEGREAGNGSADSGETGGRRQAGRETESRK